MSKGLAAALDDAAAVAEEGAREQRRAATIARRAARRERESPGGDETARAAQSALEMLSSSAERLAATVGGLRRALVSTMTDHGLSVRQIGQRLGVSHQRISTILARGRAGTARDGAARGGR